MIEYIYGFEPCEKIPEMKMVQREEIVRCRDCAYIFHRKYNNGFEYQTCIYFDSEHAEVELDGFCAWGERKEGSE